jgi:hypothetical protein
VVERFLLFFLILPLVLSCSIYSYIFEKFDYESKTKYHELLKNPPKLAPNDKKKGNSSSSSSSSGKAKPYVPKLKMIDLIQAASGEHVQYFDEKQMNVLKSLEKIQNAASDIQNAIHLFQEVDTDGSGKYLYLFLSFDLNVLFFLGFCSFLCFSVSCFLFFLYLPPSLPPFT